MGYTMDVEKSMLMMAKALKVCNRFVDNTMSFETIHELNKRATPCKILKYKLAIFLYKLFNMDFNVFEFCFLNFNQVITSRQSKFITIKTIEQKLG